MAKHAERVYCQNCLNVDAVLAIQSMALFMAGFKPPVAVFTPTKYPRLLSSVTPSKKPTQILMQYKKAFYIEIQT